MHLHPSLSVGEVLVLVWVVGAMVQVLSLHYWVPPVSGSGSGTAFGTSWTLLG